MSFDPLAPILGLSSVASPSTPSTFAPTVTRGGIAIQPGALPSSPTVGTIAADSSDGNKLKVWDGSSWVPLDRLATVHVEATSNAGQAVTAYSTNLQYENEVIDTHNAWDGTTFTAPLKGVYSVTCVSHAAASVSYKIFVEKIGPVRAFGGDTINGTAALVAANIHMSAGDSFVIHSDLTFTRSTNIDRNRITITRIGDY
jgi:hypothetical protein